MLINNLKNITFSSGNKLNFTMIPKDSNISKNNSNIKDSFNQTSGTKVVKPFWAVCHFFFRFRYKIGYKWLYSYFIFIPSYRMEYTHHNTISSIDIPTTTTTTNINEYQPADSSTTTTILSVSNSGARDVTPESLLTSTTATETTTTTTTPTTVVVKNKCSCSKMSAYNSVCHNACGCRKKGVGCSPKCKCKGKCYNGLPNDEYFFPVWRNVVIFRLIYHFVNPAKTTFLIEHNRRKQKLETDFPSDIVIDSSNRYLVDHYLRGRCEFQEMINILRASIEQAERKRLRITEQEKRKKLLVDALAVFGLKLRSDSTLCHGFIDGTLESRWNIDSVVHEMCKMKFFFEYCNIRSYFVRGVSFDLAKHIVEHKYGIPDVWPWMVATTTTTTTTVEPQNQQQVAITTTTDVSAAVTEGNPPTDISISEESDHEDNDSRHKKAKLV
ncbi:hypothetical protein PPL_06303 [Heterostelium album PN500]|uniref:Tesmin/TSO1-like CXC domain-containing protein n=1 Tax=Heterostelium pallidum (strain ATCC 26659 / Pp 5 / PN500) TaxID=670386 RepID=D3BCS5_HETP5|nr:hypothetical protein PPL_06303 [Heterostelium album PN500]EFA80717.1 hypothetical protein PPL_06303 [Heterostelium album PN500]|eukprot:XP_020432837.1 hypothetical protein PPL_06303 [Heterostelium album PN500]